MSTDVRVLCSLALACVGLLAPGARAADDDPPAVSHDEVKTGHLGNPVVIAATIHDPSGVFDPAVLYRVGGDGEFLRLPMAAKEGAADVFEAVIPGDVVSGDLEYFIEVFDERGNGPARYADADLPVKVTVLKKVEPVLIDDESDEAEDGGGGALLWIGAGVVGAGLLAAAAAGVGVAAFYLLQPPPGPTHVEVVIMAPTPVASGARP